MLQFQRDTECVALQRPQSGLVLLYTELYIHYECIGGGGILSLGLKLHAYCTLHGNINYNITRVSKFKDRFLVVACGPISPVLFYF